ncbi:hypothetical protein BJX96DRAFT_149812 [Aspergillus floccosus]
MCRQFFTLYEWCQCEEDAGQEVCGGHIQAGCPGTSIETIHMQCFCNLHATKGFKSEKKSKKRSSLEGPSEKGAFSPRRKWYQVLGMRSRTF